MAAPRGRLITPSTEARETLEKAVAQKREQEQRDFEEAERLKELKYVTDLVDRTAAIAKAGTSGTTSTKEDITYTTPWVNYPVNLSTGTKTELQLVRVDHVPKRFLGIPIGVRLASVQLYMRLTSLGDKVSGDADYVALFTPENEEKPPEIWIKKSDDPLSFPGEEPQDVRLTLDTREGYEIHKMLEALEHGTNKPV